MTDTPTPCWTRLWSDERYCIYDSRMDSRSAEEFMRDKELDAVTFTRDYGDPPDWRTRDSGRLVFGADRERLSWNFAKDFLNFMTVVDNAIFDNPSKYGSDLPPIKEGSRVGVKIGDKVITGTVSRVYDDPDGTRRIELTDDPGASE